MLLFGASRLPKLAASVGEAISEFRSSTSREPVIKAKLDVPDK